MKNTSIILFAVSAFTIQNSLAQQKKQVNATKADITSAIMAKQLDKAAALSNQLLATNASTENYLLSASVFEIKGDFKLADQLYQKAIDLKSADAFKVYNDLGYVYLRRGDTSRSISSQLKSLAMNNQQPASHHLLAILYQMRNKPDSALLHGLQAYRLDSLSTSYTRLLINTYYASGDIMKSIRYLEHLTKIQANNDSAKITLANFYLKVDRYDRALPLFLAVARDSINHDEYLFSAARCYLALNQTQDAIQSISQAISISPVVKQEYYDMLIDIYASTGQQLKVVQTYNTGMAKGIKAYQDWLAEYRDVVNETGNSLRKLPGLATDQQRAELLKLSRLYLFGKDYGNAIKVLNDYKTLGGSDTDSTSLLYSSAYLGLRRFNDAKAAVLMSNKLSATPNFELLLGILYELKDYRGIIDVINNNKSLVSAVDKDVIENLLFKSYTILGDTANATRYKQLIN